MRVGAGDELPGHHQALLGKIEVKDAVARRRVVRLLDAVQARELAADRRLLVVVVLAGEDEVIVGDRGLARIDRVAAGDLVERVDRKRRGAVRGRQQIGIDAQRRAGLDLGDPCRRDAPRRSARWSSSVRARPDRPVDRRRASTDVRNSRRPTAKMPPLRRISSSFGVSGTGLVGLALRDVGELPRHRIERELVAVLRVGDGLRALHDVQAEVEGVAPEDVAHVVAADDDHLEAGFLGDALQPGGDSSRATSRSRSDRRR